MKVPVTTFLPSEVLAKAVSKRITAEAVYNLIVGGVSELIRDLVWELKTTIEEHAQAINTNAGFGAVELTEKTIATGVIDAGLAFIPFRRHTVDTQSDDASDDLTTISGGHVGELLIISANNTARTVVVKDSAGIILAGGTDFSLDNTEDVLLLLCTATDVWTEISRSGNGA